MSKSFTKKGSPMNETQPTCPKCDGKMIQGTVVSPWGRSLIPGGTWTEGLPKVSLLWGLKLPHGKKSIPIGTYRCQSCGFLEAYARPEFEIQ